MFTLKIETGNAAFEDGAELEVARILRDLADEFEMDGSMSRNLYDSNGNKVGYSSYEPDEGEDEGDEEGPEEIDLNEARKTINWMDRDQIQEILEKYGFSVTDTEDTDGLREALFVNIEDGTISGDELP